jgi:outer membrane lipopolysaccharide assembly protein LptE/RlpB
MNALCRALLPVVVAAALAGCGYHLTGRSTSLPPEIKRIGVPMFVNKTDRPELEQRITSYVISQFLTRGRYQIVSTEEGVDAVLRGEILAFVQNPVAINSAGRATRYEILVNARATLIGTSDEKVLWQDDHFVFRRQYDVSMQQELELGQGDDSSTGFAAGGAITEESLALDKICNDFAESVVSSILEGF